MGVICKKYDYCNNLMIILEEISKNKETSNKFKYKIINLLIYFE